MKYLQVEQTKDWIAKGYSIRTIKRLIGSTYGLKSTSAVNLVFREALKQLAEGVDTETVLSINMQRLDALIEDDIKKGHHANAYRGIDLQNKAAGVYVEKKEVTIIDEYNVVF